MRRHPWRRAQCGSLGDACMVDAITKSEWLLLERSNFWVDHHAHNLPSTIISQQATNKKRTSLNNTHKLPQQHATTAINKRNNTRQQLSATIITNYNPTQHASSIMHHLVYGWSTIIDMLDVLHALGSMSFLNISTGRWTFAWFSLCHSDIVRMQQSFPKQSLSYQILHSYHDIFERNRRLRLFFACCWWQNAIGHVLNPQKLPTIQNSHERGCQALVVWQKKEETEGWLDWLSFVFSWSFERQNSFGHQPILFGMEMVAKRLLFGVWLNEIR